MFNHQHLYSIYSAKIKNFYFQRQRGNLKSPQKTSPGLQKHRSMKENVLDKQDNWVTQQKVGNII